MISIVPITAWSTPRNRNLHIPFHTHDYHELVFYESGSGTGQTGGQNYRFSSGNFLLIPPCTPHDETHQSDGFLICIGFRAETTVPSGLFYDSEGKIKRIVREILSEVTEQNYDYKKMLVIKLNELILTAERIESTAAAVKDFAFAAAYLKSNCHEKISLPTVAAQMNLSYDYFRHCFREQIGISPQQYLIRARLSSAERLLSDSRLSCTEIAYRCGFSNSPQFSQLFRREYGISPREFRKKS